MEPESEPSSPAIQPVGSNHAVAPKDSAVVSASYEKELKDVGDYDLDQEEQARKIAHDDLGIHKKQRYGGLMLAWLSFQSIGTIYGDIGTSPLYVYSSTFTSQPSWDDLVGALSIIIWALTLIVTVKYTFIVLHADDDGQGGTFALYSLLARFARITTGDPNVAVAPTLERHATNDMEPLGRGFRSFLETSRTAKFLLKLTGVVGVSMVLADGVLTPAQSVLGAIQGITVADPNLSTSAIVGISCAILVVLFAIQPFGTTKLGTSFAPIVVVWLLFNLCSGIYNLALYDYTVLKAFSPYFAGAYLVRNGYQGWRSLGGLLLAFTGVEALFADLGAFSKRAIQISWLGLVYPCLLFAYIGQAAYISDDATGTAYTNPFFYTVPPGSFYFSMVIAVLAAVVASQAMITSSFQLLTQVMRLSYFPHIKTVHTSAKFHEQVYMPLANWLLMIGTVIVTAVYNNTTSLGNAYGVCVIFVTFITTCMVTIVAIVSWRIPSYIVLSLFLVFAALDGTFLSAALVKVPDGAWFTLLLAAILSTIFILWRFGKENQWAAEGANHLRLADLLAPNANSNTPSTSPSGRSSASNTNTTTNNNNITIAPPTPPNGSLLTLTTVPGLGIFFDKLGAPRTAPTVFAQFVRKFRARPRVTVFFHMRPLSRPRVPPAERYVITRAAAAPAPAATAADGEGGAYMYCVTLRHGYLDDVLRPELGREVVEALVLYVTRDRSLMRVGSGVVAGGCGGGGSGGSPARSVEHTAAVQAELDALHKAAEDQTVYVIGKEVMKIKRRGGVGGFLRWVVLEAFLWIRENSRTKLADLDIDPDSLVEVGFVKQI